MTATSAKNSFGIFKSKRAKLLAIQYNLPIYNPYAYGSHYLVYYKDVLFIVDNLWLDHFIYNTNIPLNVSNKYYYHIYYKLQNKYPDLFFT